PLSRLNGWIETGAVAGIVGGMVLGGFLQGNVGSESGAASSVVWKSLPLAILAVLVLNIISLVTLLPVGFPSDMWRKESPKQALSGFFRDASRILRNRECRGLLLGLATFRGLVAAVTGAIVANTLSRSASAPGIDVVWELLGDALWVMLGAAAGSLL